MSPTLLCSVFLGWWCWWWCFFVCFLFCFICLFVCCYFWKATYTYTALIVIETNTGTGIARCVRFHTLAKSSVCRNWPCIHWKSTFGTRSVYTVQPCTSLQCVDHFIRSHLCRVHHPFFRNIVGNRKQTMEYHGKGTKSWTTKDRPPPPPPPHTSTCTCMHASKHASTTERHWHAHIHACAFSDPNLPVDPTLFFRWCKHMHVASKTIPESTRIKEHRHFTTLCSTQCLMEPDESAMGAFVVKPPPPPPKHLPYYAHPLVSSKPNVVVTLFKLSVALRPQRP